MAQLQALSLGGVRGANKEPIPGAPTPPLLMYAFGVPPSVAKVNDCPTSGSDALLVGTVEVLG